VITESLCAYVVKAGGERFGGNLEAIGYVSCTANTPRTPHFVR
jgi:hypothetical protein